VRVGLVIGGLGYGGAERQLYNLAVGLAATDHVVVYCLSDVVEPWGKRLSDAGVELRIIASRGGLSLRRVVSLASSLRQDRIELVHAFLFIASSYAWLATRLLPGVLLVGSARNCKPEPSLLRRWVIRRAFQGSAAVICNSQAMADYAVEHYGLQRKRSSIVYNGVGEEFFVDNPAPSEGLVIGTVGRLQPQKNLGMFLEAARLVLEGDPEARFVIAGGGSLRGELENRSSELGLAHAISFRGNVDDIASMLASLGQFWLCSDWEGAPNVVLEAMAAGLPVVATPAGGTPELLDEGRTGWLVDFGDASALAGRALQLAADTELAASVGAAAREEARHRFSIPVMVSETRKVYELAVSGGAG